MKTEQMHVKDACKILGLSGDIRPETTKQAYRKACAKFHPDKNPAGLEMMKLINCAYDALRDYSGSVEISETVQHYSDDLAEAITLALSLWLDVEVCGAWVWISGDTKPHREALKAAAFRWAPVKKRWYFRPSDYRSHSRGKFSMEQIREKFGSQNVAQQDRRLLSAA